MVRLLHFSFGAPISLPAMLNESLWTEGRLFYSQIEADGGVGNRACPACTSTHELKKSASLTIGPLSCSNGTQHWGVAHLLAPTVSCLCGQSSAAPGRVQTGWKTPFPIRLPGRWTRWHPQHTPCALTPLPPTPPDIWEPHTHSHTHTSSALTWNGVPVTLFIGNWKVSYTYIVTKRKLFCLVMKRKGLLLVNTVIGSENQRALKSGFASKLWSDLHDILTWMQLEFSPQHSIQNNISLAIKSQYWLTDKY